MQMANSALMMSGDVKTRAQFVNYFEWPQACHDCWAIIVLQITDDKKKKKIVQYYNNIDTHKL